MLLHLWFPSPHSGILFLSVGHIHMFQSYKMPFPSPHSGILFLFLNLVLTYAEQGNPRFRPLIRGFFFYYISNITHQAS